MPQFLTKLASRPAALLCLGLTLLPLPGLAAIDNAQAYAIYTESGAELQLQLIARTFPDGIRETLVQHPAGKRFNPLAVTQVARQAFDPAVTQPPLTVAIREGLTAEEAAEVLKWLRSDLGRRIVALDAAAAGPKAEAELARFAGRVQKELPPESRLVLVQNLDKAVRLTDLATQNAMGLSVASSLGTISRAPDIDRQVLDQLRVESEHDRGVIREVVSEQTFAYLLFAYRSLSDDDLKRYIEYAKSPAGIAWQRTLMRGLDEAIVQGTLKLGEGLNKLLQPAPAR